MVPLQECDNTQLNAIPSVNKVLLISENGATTKSKLLLLIGPFEKEEAQRLFSHGYPLYQLPFASDLLTIEQMRMLPAREIAAILIKNDEQGLQSRQIDAIRKLKLHTAVPVILYTQEVSEAIIAEIKKYRVIDDAISSLDDVDDLEFKINFLSRYKKLVSSKIVIPNHAKHLNRSVSHFLRRTLDILVSSALLLMLLPLFIVVALAIKIESRGPIFYISKRAGRRYKIFKFYKFRTMVVNADKKLQDLSHLNQYNGKEKDDKTPKFLKIKDDPRVTKIGSFLRNTSIDELPQLLNVLLGHMSLVGNRPLPLYEAATLTNDHWANRFDAPAGITGLWQIMKRGEEEMSIEERIELDIAYAKNNSLFVDLWIMVKTPFAMLQKSNV
ncbi:sugar transferase [Danxiaibacter flavus]|uniref:Sugar transferase n=1 Tax=Danxiaibacter flavus TaxID=3049108 RepID=A0ABV3ZDD2_9BACT|nr:sugar transferase [Chitinophagaceae bacterium DXS]